MKQPCGPRYLRARDQKLFISSKMGRKGGVGHGRDRAGEVGKQQMCGCLEGHIQDAWFRLKCRWVSIHQYPVKNPGPTSWLIGSKGRKLDEFNRKCIQ